MVAGKELRKALDRELMGKGQATVHTRQMLNSIQIKALGPLGKAVHIPVCSQHCPQTEVLHL